MDGRKEKDKNKDKQKQSEPRSSAEKYREFRKTYSEFIYHGYQTEETEDELKIWYHFEIPGLAEFRPSWRFPKDKEHCSREDMIFSLGMVELVSYWKITCSPRVVIKAGKLSAEQILWWKNLYFHGLGEFFYVNRIEEAQIENFMEIVVDLPKERQPEELHEQMGLNGRPDLLLEGSRVMVPIGGGKDSAVTLELLKEAKADIWGYVINPRGATIKTAQVAGLNEEKLISVSRTLDKAMLELNQKGFLNGHTPFSAIVAFSSLLAAELYGIGYIALSNESSANESTIQGSTVNHQYSKSFQFEKDFHEYVKKYLPGGSYYFSMLRPLSEFQIAGYFSACKVYHPIFRSCNVGSKTDEWCGHCPKCLFVAAILSPFLRLEELKEIFGKNLFEDENLWETLEQLTGIQEEKPFECVGSRREVNAALFLAIERMEKSERSEKTGKTEETKETEKTGGREKEKLPGLLARYRIMPQYDAARKLGDVYSDYFDEENLVPAPWKELVRRRCTGEDAKKRIIG